MRSSEPHPDAQQLIDQSGVAPPTSSLSPEGARLLFDDMFEGEPELDPVDVAQDYLIDGPGGSLPIRTLTPDGDGPFPILLWLHGGGWVFGDLDSAEQLLRQIANEAGCLVISVDYRLSPEAKFPAAIEDGYAALEWAAEYGDTIRGDPSRIAVGGGSAGGNLAAAVTLLARDRGEIDVAHQTLLYPILDYALDTDSYEENAEGYLLTRDAMEWFWEQYLPHDIAGYNSYASPNKARDLSGLPASTVIVAGYDPLRDEGIEYAERLEAAGVQTNLVNFEGMVHGFIGWGTDKGREARAIVVEDLRASFAE